MTVLEFWNSYNDDAGDAVKRWRGVTYCVVIENKKDADKFVKKTIEIKESIKSDILKTVLTTEKLYSITEKCILADTGEILCVSNGIECGSVEFYGKNSPFLEQFLTVEDFDDWDKREQIRRKLEKCSAWTRITFDF